MKLVTHRTLIKKLYDQGIKMNPFNYESRKRAKDKLMEMDPETITIEQLNSITGWNDKIDIECDTCGEITTEAIDFEIGCDEYYGCPYICMFCIRKALDMINE